MDIVIIVLRILHIFGGVFWVGAAWMLVFFIEPASRAAGQGGQVFMQKLMQTGKLSVYISIAAVITVLAGGALYFMIWWQIGFASLKTIGFTIGGILGVISLGIGGGVTGPTSGALARLGGEIAAGGKPPTPEQAGRLQALQSRMSMATRWNAWISSASLLLMAIARYL